MARLFAMIGNRPDLASRVLLSESRALGSVMSTSETRFGWGVGFYQHGEVLLRRKPIDDRDVLSPAELVLDLRGDAVIGHIRRPTIGGTKPENTHPFRYRQWLFAQTGTLSFLARPEIATTGRARMLEAVSDHLRANVVGETDAELVFQLFLSFLSDAKAVATERPNVAASALRSAYQTVRAVAAELGDAGSLPLNLVVSSGEWIVALNAGAAMAVREFGGREDMDALFGDDLALRRSVPSPDRVRFTLIASDFDGGHSSPPASMSPASSSPLSSSPGSSPVSSSALSGVPREPWRTLANASVVILEREQAPQVETL
jgi:predicted glutamine amidotransferase